MLDHLPIGILEDILLRLPAKTNFQLRCVSKKYSSLTKDPYFIDRLVLHQPMTRKLMYLRGGKMCSLDYDASIPKVVIDHSLDVVRIWGHCNGFLCLTSRQNGTDVLMLWNPYTRESKKVPNAPKHEYECMYLFGYDAAARDYIVVGVHPNESHSEIEVYSLRKNSWRKMPDIPYTGNYHERKGYFVNGSFYWVALFCNHQPQVVVDYNPGTGEVVEVLLPDFVDSNYTCLEVGSVDGNLCVFVHYGFNEESKAWVVKRCAATKFIWTKLDAPLPTGSVPLSYVNNGAGMLLCAEYYGLSVYDFESGSTNRIKFKGSPDKIYGAIIFDLSKRRFAEATTYVESFLPLCSEETTADVCRSQ